MLFGSKIEFSIQYENTTNNNGRKCSTSWKRIFLFYTSVSVSWKLFLDQFTVSSQAWICKTLGTEGRIEGLEGTKVQVAINRLYLHRVSLQKKKKNTKALRLKIYSDTNLKIHLTIFLVPWFGSRNLLTEKNNRNSWKNLKFKQP